jgi:hypothetical protein
MAVLHNGRTKTSLLELLGRAIYFHRYILACASLNYLYQKARKHPPDAKILTTTRTSFGMLRSLCAGLMIALSR